MKSVNFSSTQVMTLHYARNCRCMRDGGQGPWRVAGYVCM